MLRGGLRAHIRPIRPEDRPRLAAFYRGLSPDSRSHRFLAAVGDDFLEKAATRFSQTDPAVGGGLVATAQGEDRIIGHAMYAVIGNGRAEVAFAIADDWQEHGLATLLLGEMARLAGSMGIRVFEAIVLPDNHQMLAVFRDSGFVPRMQAVSGEIHVELPTWLSANRVRLQGV